MPKGVITIENPVKGWAKNNTSQIPVEGPLGTYSNSSFMSPFRDNKIRHIAPGELFTALTDAGTRVNDLPLDAVVASNGETFAILKNARLVRWGVGDGIIDANYDVTAHGGHTVQSTENQNLVVVRDLATTPVEYVIRFWGDDVDADAGIIKNDGSGADDDWLSTRTNSGVLTKGVPLIPIQAQESVVHFTHGQYIGSITINSALTDATGATIQRFRLNLGAGWILTSICKWADYTIVVGYRANLYTGGFALAECRAWFWNGSSDNPNMIRNIADNYVSRVFVEKGIPKVISQGRGNMLRVWKFNGADFEVEFEYSTAGVGNAPKHGSFDFYQGVPHWGQGSGNFDIMAYDAGAFHYRAHPYSDTASLSDVGMVKDLSANGLYAGVKQSTNYKILQISASLYYPGANFKSALFRLPFKSTIERTIPYFSQFGSGASATFSIYKDYDTGATDWLNTQLTNTTLGAVSAHAINKRIKDINSGWMKVTFDHASSSATAAIVAAVKIEYDYKYQT